MLNRGWNNWSGYFDHGKGVEYLGVGLPFGMIIGVVVYLSSMHYFHIPEIDDSNQNE